MGEKKTVTAMVAVALVSIMAKNGLMRKRKCLIVWVGSLMENYIIIKKLTMKHKNQILQEASNTFTMELPIGE